MRIKITVQDNGVGLKYAQKTRRLPDFKEKSLGITSIREKIEMINLQYADKVAGFSIKPGPDGQGTLAVLTLPLLTTVKLKEVI